MNHERAGGPRSAKPPATRAWNAAAEEPQAGAGHPAVEAAGRVEPDRLQHHGHGALHVEAGVERIDPPGIGLHAALAVVDRALGLVGREIGVGELVVLALGEAPPADAQAAPAAQPIALQAAVQMVVEQLVVAELIGRDVAADLLQHRLVGRVLERAVIGAGAGLDDAARHHLAGLAAAHRRRGIERQLVAGAEAREGRLEVPLGSASCAQRPSAMPCWTSSFAQVSTAAMNAGSSAKTRFR